MINGNADALSRRPFGRCELNALDSPELQSKRVHDFQRSDPDLWEIIDYLESERLPADNARAKRILLSADIYFLGDHDLLYHLDLSEKRSREERHAQLVLPSPLRYEVLVNAHDDLTGGNLGVFKTYEKLRARYYWKGMYKDVEHWVRSCQDCSTRKKPRNKRHAPLLPIPVSGAFERIAVDILGPLPATWSGNRYIVCFIEYLTKWPEIFAVKNIDAVTIARLLTDEIIPRHGAPRTLLSDRGKNFLSNLVREVCHLYSIKKLNTSAYNPACDGLVERLNSTLSQSLLLHVDNAVNSIALLTPRIEENLRYFQRQAVFFLLHGCRLNLPSSMEHSRVLGRTRALSKMLLLRGPMALHDQAQRSSPAQQRTEHYACVAYRFVDFIQRLIKR